MEPRTPAPYVEKKQFTYTNEQVKELTKPYPVEKGPVDTGFLSPAGKVRVSEFRTIGTNQEGGNVSLHPTFKPAIRNKKLVQLALQSGATDQEILSLVYTTGTKEGFSSRLKVWGTRHVPNPVTEMKEMNITFEDVRKLLPVDHTQLPDWNQDIMTMLDEVEVNKTSSAGPPLYNTKRMCMDKCMDIIEKIIEAANRDQLGEFLAKEEELLIAHCKNKVDRYDTNKLNDKTRPYFSFSFAIQIFFSALNQPFTKASKLFYEKGANACGFSYAHGGGQRLYDWMKNTKEKELKNAIYGDDWRMVRRENSVLYSNSPDFKCMDGSVHKNIANAYVDYVLDCYRKRHGENKFWEVIGKIWKKQLVGAKFFVDGSEPYFNESSGLLTGCVGTTGVDTFLSAVAFACFKEKTHRGLDVEERDEVAQYLRRSFGLELKGDTYEWEMVDEDAELGLLVCSQQFLGAKLIMVEGRERPEAVPYKEESDLMALMSNARVPEEARTKPTILNRYLFDCARGYMITAAFHHARTWDFCCNIIEATPTETIVMRVQSGRNENGEFVGEAPELQQLCGDFEWPSSDGWPSRTFCKDVYLSESNKLGGEWYPALPGLSQKLAGFRKKRTAAKMPPIHQKPAPRKIESWADEAEREDYNAANEAAARQNVNILLAKADPFRDRDGTEREILDMPVPLMKDIPYPRPVKFRRQYQSSSKKETLLKVVEVYEEVSEDLLMVLTQYNRGFITRTLSESGWRPLEGGVWARTEEEQPTTSRAERTIQQEESWAKVPQDIVRSKIRNTDVISMVSYSFVDAGKTLKTDSKVLRNSPDPLIKVTVYLEQEVIAEGFGKTKKDAKQRVYEIMLEILDDRESPNKTQPKGEPSCSEIKNGDRSTEKEAKREAESPEGSKTRRESITSKTYWI